MLVSPLAVNLVAHGPQRREKLGPQAALQELGVLAFQRRRSQANRAIHEENVPIAPLLQAQIKLQQTLGQRKQRRILTGGAMQVEQRDLVVIQQALKVRPHLVANAEHALKARRLLP